jgi:hypothetical protein
VKSYQTLTGLTRLGVTVSVIAASAVGVVAIAAPAQAQGVGVSWSKVVSAVPAAYTPNVTNGTVYAITQVGNTVVLGGSFTGVENHGSTTTLARTDILAFDATTGAVAPGFATTLDGTVETLAPGPVANTVYAGGLFNNVNGAKMKGITLLSTVTGQVVTGFKPPALNGAVYSIATANSRLYVGGTFTKAGAAAHGGLASLNWVSGALLPYLNVQLAGHHNYNGTGAEGGVGPRAIAMNPAGTRLMVIGNFTTADTLPRDQAVMIDVDGPTSAVVDPNWQTQEFTAACFNWAFDTYVTDVQYSADGSYFVITATGGSGTNTDGTRSLCDSASRWSATDTGANVQPTWVDYTGQDSLWSVAITDTAVYVGGHERWLNNSNGYDQPGAGAVPRPGIAALDPNSGVPMAWNPGRNPRGAGAYALYASALGLYVGSDTNYIGNNKYLHQKVAYFPLSGGYTPASTATQSLPANLYLAGQLPNTNNSNVLYRVDAAGPTLAAVDNGPDWMADQSPSDPGWQYHSGATNIAGYSCCVALNPNVPASTPAALFDNEMWDSGNAASGNQMRWSFPVAAGTDVTVRLYFANNYSGTNTAGKRVFDVALDGTTVLNHYDIVADTGNLTGTMKAFDVTSPGNITIAFNHEVENPLINGIEIINDDVPPGGSGSVDDLDYRAVSGNQIGALTTVPGTGVSWGSTRGAFMVGNTVFYGTSAGAFYRASFNGTTLGAPVAVDPYNDPVWSNISTGSGQDYRGLATGYYGELSSVTGAFYSNGRLYYSLLGQSALRWRWFSPDSGIVGSQEFTVTAGTGNFGNIAGMVLSGSTLWYANRADGTLHSLPFVNGAPDSTQDTTVSGPAIDGDDWRARSLFLFGAPTFPNQLPTAAATVQCPQETCTFDGGNSNDPDGTVQGWAWTYGDGATGTGETATHTYNTSGTYAVSLVVTDNRGGQSTAWTGSVDVTVPPSDIQFVAQSAANGSTATPSVTAPAGISAGDQEFLFVTAGTAGVTTSAPTGLGGWHQVAQQTNGAIQSTVFERTATAGDSGTVVSVPLAAAAKSDLQFVDYSGVAPDAPVLTSGGDVNSTSHVAPAVSVATPGSWVLSYWSDRTSNTTAWALPGGMTGRGASYGTGGGHIDSVVADSGAAPVVGPYAALSASSTAESGRSNMISLVLLPSH